MTENPIFTPSTIFADIDFALDCNTSVISENENDGIILKEITFSGREINGKRPNGYGMLAQAGKKLPLLMVIGDYYQPVNDAFILSYAKKGFNVFMFDYSGEDGVKTKYTVYPPETDYANFLRSGTHLTLAETSARETSFFEWAVLARYALKAALGFLESGVKVGIMGIGYGADIVWMLSSADIDASAFCTVFSAGWDAYRDTFKFGEKNTLSDIDEERERWLAGIAAESYAKNVKAPMLFLSASNAYQTHMERAYDTISRISPETDRLICIEAKLSQHIGFLNKRNILLFFEKYLLDKDISLPKKALTAIENENGRVVIKVTCGSEDVEDVKLFYSEGEINPVCRNWFVCEPQKEEGFYKAAITVHDNNNLVFAYANIIYKSGFRQSTSLDVKRGAELGLDLPHLRRNNILYNSEMGTDCFTVFADERPSLNDMFFDEQQIKLKKGPDDIYGVTSLCNKLATYKTGDANFKGCEDESFKFDIYSPSQQELTVYFYEIAENGERHYHSCIVPLAGGNAWYPVEIKMQSLKSKEGFPLKSWETVSMTGFSASGEYLINNILWI